MVDTRAVYKTKGNTLSNYWLIGYDWTISSEDQILLVKLGKYIPQVFVFSSVGPIYYDGSP